VDVQTGDERGEGSTREPAGSGLVDAGMELVNMEMSGREHTSEYLQARDLFMLCISISSMDQISRITYQLLSITQNRTAKLPINVIHHA
jgi:hypothetical protein